MSWKPVIFFITIVAVTLYSIFFLENKNNYTVIKMGGKEVKIKTSTLLFGIFIDGMIIGGVLFWLFQ